MSEGSASRDELKRAHSRIDRLEETVDRQRTKLSDTLVEMSSTLTSINEKMSIFNEKLSSALKTQEQLEDEQQELKVMVTDHEADCKVRQWFEGTGSDEARNIEERLKDVAYPLGGAGLLIYGGIKLLEFLKESGLI